MGDTVTGKDSHAAPPRSGLSLALKQNPHHLLANLDLQGDTRKQEDFSVGATFAVLWSSHKFPQ